MNWPLTFPPISQMGQTPWMKKEEIPALLQALGGKALFVGGCVRNSLLDMPVKDIDMATPLKPATVMKLLRKAGIRAIPTGIDHGTVTAVFPDFNIEITTFRKDIQTDGRHAVVTYTQDWKQDAQRRDFTINALYADMDGNIYDCVGGLMDLKGRRVRFIGDPAMRIHEDALRILRYFRFQSWIGRDIDSASFDACVDNAGYLKRLSGERLRDELFRLLMLPDPLPVLRLMIRYQVLASVLPEADQIRNLSGLIARDKALLAPDPLRRLVALLDKNTDPERIKRKLKFSNEQAQRLALMMKRQLPPRLDEKKLGQKLYKLGLLATLDQILLYRKDDFEALYQFCLKWTWPKFPLSGHALIGMGMKPGKKLGAVLKRAEEWWISRNFEPDYGALMAYVKKII